jgi:hypothetical protein
VLAHDVFVHNGHRTGRKAAVVSQHKHDLLTPFHLTWNSLRNLNALLFWFPILASSLSLMVEMIFCRRFLQCQGGTTRASHW